jgi:hypothetical protein
MNSLNYTVRLKTVLGEDATPEEIFNENSSMVSKYFDTFFEAKTAYDFLATFDSFQDMELELFEDTKLIKSMKIKDEDELDKELVEKMSDTEIFHTYGISTRTLQDWKKKDDKNWRKKVYEKIGEISRI